MGDIPIFTPNVLNEIPKPNSARCVHFGQQRRIQIKIVVFFNLYIIFFLTGLLFLQSLHSLSISHSYPACSSFCPQADIVQNPLKLLSSNHWRWHKKKKKKPKNQKKNRNKPEKQEQALHITDGERSKKKQQHCPIYTPRILARNEGNACLWKLCGLQHPTCNLLGSAQACNTGIPDRDWHAVFCIHFNRASSRYRQWASHLNATPKRNPPNIWLLHRGRWLKAVAHQKQVKFVFHWFTKLEHISDKLHAKKWTKKNS